MSVSGKTVDSSGSSHETSGVSGSLTRSLHRSVSRLGRGRCTRSCPALPHLAPLLAKPKLPRLLKKAGATRSSHRHLVKITESSKKIEEQMNYEHLQKLECMFREADVDGGGGLDMDEFREAMKKMGNIPEEDIDVIFMKVDTNCDGSVDWEEYLNYMLCEYRGKDIMQKTKELPGLVTTMKPVPVSHSEEIIKIQFFPSQSRGMKSKKGENTSIGSSQSASGRFLTVSRDGILQVWSDSFKLLRTVNLDQRKLRPGVKLWVMDMVCLPNINLMAVASTEQNIGVTRPLVCTPFSSFHAEFFDIGGNKCDLQFSLELDLGQVLTRSETAERDTLSVFRSSSRTRTDGFKGVFCVGDVKGNILIFTSLNVVTSGLFNIRAYIGLVRS
uniref:Uncharacterized protein n=1 Tax=Sphaerodactylus townsendi TaxID=933632 RepID=A0ACB8F6N7_9SAUR